MQTWLNQINIAASALTYTGQDPYKNYIRLIVKIQSQKL